MYAWVAGKGDDILPLIGSSRVASFDNSLKARDLALTIDDMKRIESIVAPQKIAGSGQRKTIFENGKIMH